MTAAYRKRFLLWKLCGMIAIGVVLLFWLVDVTLQQTEQNMSFIKAEYQQQLLAYGKEAESIYRSNNREKLTDWLENLQKREKTWAAVVESQVKPIANSRLSQQFLDSFRLGRHVEWKIHLYFKENPIMDMVFEDKRTHFLIRLPQRMRPGKHLFSIHMLLQVALPLLLLGALSLLLYRHVMAPLQKLEKATRQFSDGNFDVRIKSEVGTRNDEIAVLADTFDHMAERTSELISHQRQLLADLSHEVRTPLARIDMAVDCVEQGIHPEKALMRLRYESATVRELVEDTLTLVWLSNEKPQLNQETFDMVELIQVICEDARFEYPDHKLLTDLPEQSVLINSSQRALGQALENIIRNALNHTATQDQVVVSMQFDTGAMILTIKDSGPGVPQHLLKDIFRPFFQVDKSRLEKNTSQERAQGKKRGGFGLGLALAQRQIAAAGGCVYAENHYDKLSADIAGLQVVVTLPCKA